MDITFPVCRIVQGDVYKPRTTDDNGAPLVYKSGAKIGQPRNDYFIAIAIPKRPGEASWQQTAWGAAMVQFAQAESKGLNARADYAWKVLDGDGQNVMQNGKRPCDNENFRGHWIVRMSSGFAPKVFKIENGALMEQTQPDFCKRGHYVEVFGSVNANNDQRRPGLFVGHTYICWRDYGPEIIGGPDVSKVGFGQGALPPGAGGGAPIAAMPGNNPAAPAQYVPPAVQPVPAGVAVQPNPAFVANAAVQAPPAPYTPPAPPAPLQPQHVMTAAAQGATYEQFISAGWTDAQLIANGMMVA